MLAFGALLLPGGVQADRLGHRRVFLLSLVGFAITSVACALAPSMPLLVVARGLQGACAGVVAASALGVVLTHYVDARQRAIAMTVWSALGVVGAVVGSLVAGPVISWLGWPGVFWLNVVAVAVLLPFAVTKLSPGVVVGSSASSWPAIVAAGGAAMILAGLSVAGGNAVLGVALALAGVLLVVGIVASRAGCRRRSCQ